MNSRIVIVLILTMALCTSFAFAAEDIVKHPTCKFCSMDREKYATSRVLIDYEDGSSEGMCSLRCAAVEMALGIDKFAKAIRVGDATTGALLDAEKAVWVLGGKKPGVMTKRAKWAFGAQADAEKFIQENGGTLVAFEAAVKAAYEDLYDDTKMIRERREAKRKAAAEKK
jgi:nitrous oxide reductase accessory protein NosL